MGHGMPVKVWRANERGCQDGAAHWHDVLDHQRLYVIVAGNGRAEADLRVQRCRSEVAEGSARVYLQLDAGIGGLEIGEVREKPALQEADRHPDRQRLLAGVAQERTDRKSTRLNSSH